MLKGFLELRRVTGILQGALGEVIEGEFNLSLFGDFSWGHVMFTLRGIRGMLTSGAVNTEDAMKIKGTKAADVLVGTDEADIIKGGRGRDLIDGCGDNDVLVGGKGADTFLLRSDAEGVAHITDFQPGRDRIILEAPEQWWASYDVTTGSIASGTLAVPVPGGVFGPVVAIVDGPPHLFNQYQDLITI